MGTHTHTHLNLIIMSRVTSEDIAAAVATTCLRQNCRGRCGSDNDLLENGEFRHADDHRIWIVDFTSTNCQVNPSSW
jgi:hypothetical protein